MQQKEEVAAVWPAEKRREVRQARAAPATQGLRCVAVSPGPGARHECTLLYLHGFCGCAQEYLASEDDGFNAPWRLGDDYAPNLRTVLPTAPRRRQPWGEIKTAWYSYASLHRNGVGEPRTLAEMREQLCALLHAEIAKLGGKSHRVFLGGLSQGCAVALDLYLREGPRLGLGGFVGSVGVFPTDVLGFVGADAALDHLCANEAQASRPVWLQCATDDEEQVPWSVVKASLRRARGRLPGLVVKKVCGWGHDIGTWEADVINDFLKAHVDEAYD